jgi:hypothetical protein
MLNKKKLKPWCYWQMKCKEDVFPNSWTCTAHLSEGLAFKCPKRNMKHAKQIIGKCEDAEPYIK